MITTLKTAALLAGVCIGVADAALPQAVHVRGGLPNVQARLLKGEALVVACLGGSITQNAGVGGFVHEIPNLLKELGATSEVSVVNCGKAGTGSDFGACRIDRDVFSAHPHLLVVEFAVNDANRDCVSDMERIVRKTWSVDARTDILFLYTVAKGDLAPLMKGKLPPSVMQHEKLAEYYRVPSVLLGAGLCDRISAGDCSWLEFSSDDCHPTEFGYGVYNDLLGEALKQILPVGSAHAHVLGDPLTPGLRLYPVPAVAQALPPTSTFVDARGRRADCAYSLPVPGIHWIGQPTYIYNEGATWTLYAQPAEEPVLLAPTAGLTRSNWRPLEWFEEGQCFVGSSSDPLVGRGTLGSTNLGASTSETSILLFTADRRGEYIFKTALGGMGGFSDKTKAVALNVVRFRVNGSMGESVGFHTAMRGEMKPVEWEIPVVLEAGDSLAYVFLKKNLGNAEYQGLKVVVGRYGVATAP